MDRKLLKANTEWQSIEFNAHQYYWVQRVHERKRKEALSNHEKPPTVQEALLEAFEEWQEEVSYSLG